jgi:hypothetical protein
VSQPVIIEVRIASNSHWAGTIFDRRSRNKAACTDRMRNQLFDAIVREWTSLGDVRLARREWING